MIITTISIIITTAVISTNIKYIPVPITLRSTSCSSSKPIISVTTDAYHIAVGKHNNNLFCHNKEIGKLLHSRDIEKTNSERERAIRNLSLSPFLDNV